MKMRRNLAIGTALITGAVLAMSGPVLSDEKDGMKKKVEMARGAKVSIDQAIKAASDKVQGTVIEAELEMKHDKPMWEIEIVTGDNKVVEVHVDSVTAAIEETKEKMEKKEHKKKHNRKQKQSREHKD